MLSITSIKNLLLFVASGKNKLPCTAVSGTILLSITPAFFYILPSSNKRSTNISAGFTNTCVKDVASGNVI